MRDQWSWEKSDYDFLEFFATPIPNFDETILDLLPEEGLNSDMKKLVYENVRELQEAEVLFWNSVYEEGKKSLD